MNNIDIIADRIEEVISLMFTNFQSVDSGLKEYSIFYNPEKHTSWIILIFFEDNIQLKQAIRNGVCYEVHSFLLNELKNIDETSNIDRAIFFESGNRPVKQFDIDNLFLTLVTRLASINKVKGVTDISDCGSCGHSFDKHQLLGNMNEGAPTEGWIMCPEDNCNCFQTWSANYTEENLKVESHLSKMKQAFLKLFK